MDKYKISELDFQKKIKWITLENMQWQLVHTRSMWWQCQFIYDSSIWQNAKLITPRTRKIYNVKVTDIYPTNNLRKNIINKYMNNFKTKEEKISKVKERFWED